MGALLEKFMDLSTPKKSGIWVGAILFLTFIFWQYFYKDLHQQKFDLTEKVANLNMQIIEQRRIAENLPKFKEEIAELDGRLEVVVQELPDKKQIDNLLQSVSVLAIDTGLEVTQFAPQREQRKEFVAAVPVLIELEGTFHQLATFFDEVGHLARIVNIDNIEIVIVEEGDQEVTIRAKCNATSFRYLDESERIEAKPAVGRGRGRKKGGKSKKA